MSKEFSGAPQFVKYFAPLLDALHQLGGSGRVDEVRSVIAQRLNLSEEEQSEPLPSKTQARFDNQVHWARFYLTKAGLLGSSQRGVWTLTEKGQADLPLADADARRQFREISSTFAKSKNSKSAGSSATGEVPIADEDSALVTLDYREELAARLLGLSRWF